MKIQQFLEHHKIVSNPFAEEDAQTDPVFREHCIASTYHPTWDKVYGNPRQPATSLVFGEKGAGKTAMRLQVVQHLGEHNRQNPGERLYIVEYDDFNPFLDRFAERLSQRKRQQQGKVLAEFKLWDHMDAILSLAVTSLIDQVLKVRHPSGPLGNEVSEEDVRKLDRHQVRDLLVLASCYDQSTAETFKGRWHRLRQELKFRVWKSKWDKALGLAVLVAVIGIISATANWDWLATPWPYVIAAAAWIPLLCRMWKWHWKARGIVKHLRVGTREVRPLRQVLMNFSGPEISEQPLPNKDRTDDRYELLMKLQGILKTLGFPGIIVLVDRVDEPHLINGSAERMKALLWPMLDNKFLKHPGLGFKLLLPVELTTYIDREDREFYQRARLDKQNMIPSLEWTGEALYDVANARLKACAHPGSAPNLKVLFDETISERRLFEALRSLRVPRHLFKFMYRLLVAHCNAHTDDDPVWQISSNTFESVLAVYSRDQDSADKGMKAGA